MNLSVLISAIAPVLVMLALGFGAGKQQAFDADQARGLSHLALSFALPAALFLGMAHFNRSLLLQQGPVVLVMLIGYAALYPILFVGMRALGMDKLRAALLGYTFVSTAAPIYGLTVLVPIYGQEIGAGIVGLAALVTNLAQVSVAVFLLQSAAADRGRAPSPLVTLGRSAANPLVWSPLAGTALALSGLQLSPYISAALTPLAVSAGGVAIFASGLVLSAHRPQLTSPAVLIGSFICLVAQPAVFFLIIKLGGFAGTTVQAAFVASAMPTSTLSVLFAQQYGTCESETASIMLVTTLGMVVALPVALGLSGYV